MRSAPNSGRRVGVVSTTAISLTAAICGVSAPAAADPMDDFSSPSTTISAPEPEFEMPQLEMPSFEVPSFEPPAPVQQAPVEQAPIEPEPVQQAPVEPEPVQETPVEPAPAAIPETTEPAPDPAPEPVPSDTPAPVPAVETTSDTAPSDTAPSDTVTPEPSTSVSTAPVAVPSTEPSTVTSVAVEPRAVPEARPESLTAPEADVAAAQTARPVEVEPAPAPITEVNDFRQQVTNLTTNNTVINQNNTVVNNTVVRSNVVQYNTQWVQYDNYYRPRICNPYRAPLRVVYYYDGAPRVSIIPPLGNIVVEAAAVGAYNFTAMVLNAAGVPTNVAVGSFFGGGYVPGPGLPPPPPPPRLVRYDNVPVQVRYTSATYRPFRVQRVIDAGYDQAVGQRKVLLDGVTPAWGDWKQNSAGERQFEINQTQQFPGLDSPAQVPLPGDYPLELVSDEASGLSLRDKILIGLAGTLGALALAAVGLSVHLNRRRPRI